MPLICSLCQQCPFEDPAADKLFIRFKARLSEHFAVQLKSFDEQECFRNEAFQALFEFIGVVEPTHHRESSVISDAEHNTPSPKAKKVRRQRCVIFKKGALACRV